MANVIISPHIDDAVFSCWHLLQEPDASVVTMFAGVPAKGTKTLWDWICGTADGESMMQKRLQENAAVFDRFGVTFHNLDYLDRQYRPSKRDIAEMADAILAVADKDSTFFAPLAGSKFYRHPDHIAVREVGKRLLDQGRNVSFYVDIPYMQTPARPTPELLRRMSQRASKIIERQCSATVTEISEQEQAGKREAMHTYQSQYTMTNLAALGTLGRTANVQREITFSVAT